MDYYSICSDKCFICINTWEYKAKSYIASEQSPRVNILNILLPHISASYVATLKNYRSQIKSKI